MSAFVERRQRIL